MNPQDALFDLAVARASAYLQRVRAPQAHDADAIARTLEVWMLKTRFASRVDVPTLARALASRPTRGGARWQGGPHGGWIEVQTRER